MAADSGDEEELRRSHTFRVVGTVTEPTTQKGSTFVVEEYSVSARMKTRIDALAVIIPASL